MEDDLRWKTTFDGRQPSMEDNLRFKMTFDGRGPSMEDDIGRRPSMEDDLRWKTTFDGRQPITIPKPKLIPIFVCSRLAKATL